MKDLSQYPAVVRRIARNQTAKEPRKIGWLARLVRSFLAMRTESLWHPESPGMRVAVTRSRFGRWVKPTKFATLGETLKSYRANVNVDASPPLTPQDHAQR